MFFDLAPGDQLGDTLVLRDAPRWGVSSEYGRLTDVMLSAPDHLEMLPCNSVTRASLADGYACSPEVAVEQHEALRSALTALGVRCHAVIPLPGMADLTFMRDAAVMTPWGLVELRPGAEHRRAEAAHVAATAAELGIPLAGRIQEGTVEGGDVCILRPGVAAIGYSGERTTKAGARALAALFEAKGWEVIFCPFDPHHLHLDTQFTMLSRNRAVACVDILDRGFLQRIADLGIALIPATEDEVGQLGANLLSLGDDRIVSPLSSVRMNAELRRHGFDVTEVNLGQFIRCGGGIHCLTLPLARYPV